MAVIKKTNITKEVVIINKQNFSSLLVDISSIDLSVRAFNALRAISVSNLFDCLILGKNGLLKSKTCGVKTLREIEDKLSDYGFQISENGCVVTEALIVLTER